LLFESYKQRDDRSPQLTSIAVLDPSRLSLQHRETNPIGKPHSPCFVDA
jgi:hypothetical protein